MLRQSSKTTVKESDHRTIFWYVMYSSKNLRHKKNIDDNQHQTFTSIDFERWMAMLPSALLSMKPVDMVMKWGGGVIVRLQTKKRKTVPRGKRKRITQFSQKQKIGSDGTTRTKRSKNSARRHMVATATGTKSNKNIWKSAKSASELKKEKNSIRRSLNRQIKKKGWGVTKKGRPDSQVEALQRQDGESRKRKF